MKLYYIINRGDEYVNNLATEEEAKLMEDFDTNIIEVLDESLIYLIESEGWADKLLSIVVMMGTSIDRNLPLFKTLEVKDDFITQVEFSLENFRAIEALSNDVLYREQRAPLLEAFTVWATNVSLGIEVRDELILSWREGLLNKEPDSIINIPEKIKYYIKGV